MCFQLCFILSCFNIIMSLCNKWGPHTVYRNWFLSLVWNELAGVQRGLTLTPLNTFEITWNAVCESELLNGKWTVLTQHSSRLPATQSASTTQDSIHILSSKVASLHQELIHTFTHQWSSHEEQICGSVFQPRTLWHVDQRSRDQTTDLLIGRRPTLPAEPQLLSTSVSVGPHYCSGGQVGVYLRSQIPKLSS